MPVRRVQHRDRVRGSSKDAARSQRLGGGMALTGSLHDFDLSYIFQIVAQEGKTGKLVLDAGDDQGEVVFDRGRIVSAGTRTKDLKKALLVYVVDVKNAPYSAVRRLADRLKENIRSLGDHFVNGTYVTSAELTRFVEMTLEDLTCELFLWKEGTYRFDALDKVDHYRVNEVALPAEGITMEAARRTDEWERLKPRISPHTVFVLSERARSETHAAPAAGPLDDPADYLCSFLDGATSVEFLCRRAWLTEFRVYETLNALLDEEWIFPLGDKLSSSIHEALRREVKPRRYRAGDIAVASVVALLLVSLVLVVAAMVPGSVVRRERQALQQTRAASLGASVAEKKYTAATSYYHAAIGHPPAEPALLIDRDLLSPRDIAARDSRHPPP
ncbi:MAG: DUF4388 domain-containing protein [Chitinivibrionales bacterium]|nr:DUF4388 domain-containing protein [Chitinivibrionales bacterium]MBD3394081.1 DUF4388 domain-containing protein [Chitinivibrionales bacterium]